jgi:hypothetical protein
VGKATDWCAMAQKYAAAARLRPGGLKIGGKRLTDVVQ